MDEIKVEIIKAGPEQRLLDRARHRAFLMMAARQLGRDANIVSAYIVATAAISFAGNNSAWAMALGIDELLGVCHATSLAEATEASERLVWMPEDTGALEDWRSGFLSYNGGPVEVIGWRQGNAEKDEALSFWIAGGSMPIAPAPIR